MSRKALGKGLDALIPGAGAFSSRTIQEIDIREVRSNPLQPRLNFDQDSLNELAESIKHHGVLQPILVRRVTEGYEIITGERRFRAAKQAGLTTVPAMVEETGDQERLEIALIENLQREDLNPIELAQGIKNLIENFALTQEQAAERIGKNRSTISNLLRLLELPIEVQGLVREGKLSLGHAKAILTAPEQERIALAQRVITDSLSVRETEKLAQKMNLMEKEARPRLRPLPTEEERSLANLIADHLSVQVKVKKGEIAIKYRDLTELKRLCSLILHSGLAENDGNLD